MGQFTDPPAPRPRDEPGDVGGYRSYPDDHQHWPDLTEFIGASRFTNGEPRQTGSILLFVDDGMLKVMFKDGETERVGFTSLTSLETVLDDLNRKLETGHVDWRRDKNRRRR